MRENEDMERETQNKKVLKYMRINGSITTRDAAIDLGIYRLSARIFDLRKAGYNIVGDWIYNEYGTGTRYVRYRLMEYD